MGHTCDNPHAVKMLHLPETMANWPWPRNINPHYEEVKTASMAWINSFKAFTPQSQRAFDKGAFGLIASLAYPWIRKEHLRTGCDLMNFFFVVDEYTDVENAATAQEMVDIVIDALNHPHKPRPKGETILGEIARQFWELAIKTTGPNAQRHFINSFTAYLKSIVYQAADRDADTFRTIDSYLETRRNNIGIRPSFVPIELAMDLPDEVLYHPVIAELSNYIADLVLLDNDIASYNKEQSVGDDRHNIVTLAMRQFNTDYKGAIAWVANYHAEVEAKFISGLKRVPSWGPKIDKQMQEYILGLANWPRANDCWNFECGRYFGDKGLEIQRSRYVPLLPKVQHNPHLHGADVIVPLVEF